MYQIWGVGANARKAKYIFSLKLAYFSRIWFMRHTNTNILIQLFPVRKRNYLRKMLLDDISMTRISQIFPSKTLCTNNRLINGF